MLVQGPCGAETRRGCLGQWTALFNLLLFLLAILRPPIHACMLSRFSHVQILCDPMGCSLPGSSVHEVSQARMLESVAMPPPGDLPDPGIRPASLMSPALAGRFFTIRSHFPLKTCLFHRTHVAQKDETIFSNSMFFSSLLTHPVRLRPFDSTNSKSTPFSFPFPFLSFLVFFFFPSCCQSPRSFFSLFN